jgi:hypothetical protein
MDLTFQEGCGYFYFVEIVFLYIMKMSRYTDLQSNLFGDKNYEIE